MGETEGSRVKAVVAWDGKWCVCWGVGEGRVGGQKPMRFELDGTRLICIVLVEDQKKGARAENLAQRAEWAITSTGPVCLVFSYTKNTLSQKSPLRFPQLRGFRLFIWCVCVCVCVFCVFFP